MKTRQAAGLGAALLLGVGNLSGSHYGSNITDLQSPVKDTNDYELITKLKGFEAQSVVDVDATRKKVLSILQKFAKSLKAGDFFLMTFSGFGGCISNFGSSKPQGTSPTWCLFDAQLLVSEVMLAFSSFQVGVNILVIEDSSSPQAGVNIQPWQELPKSGHLQRALPNEIAETVYLMNKDYYDGVYLATLGKPIAIKANLIWFAACQLNQVAYETAYNGYLTAAIKHVWNGNLFDGNYHDFFKKTTLRLPVFQSPLVQSYGPNTEEFMLKEPFLV